MKFVEVGFVFVVDVGGVKVVWEFRLGFSFREEVGVVDLEDGGS